MADDIIKYYPVFESNQVLTQSQLNELRKYLDGQERLTRSAMIGKGIVNGLNALYSSQEGRLVITSGFGISSDGYFINLKQNKEYVKYWKVDQFSNLYYSFNGLAVYELLPECCDCPGAVELAQALPEDDLNNKAVVIYLESQDQKRLCTNHERKIGKRRVFEVKVLLLDLDNHFVANYVDAIPDLLIRRLNNLDEIYEYNDLAYRYHSIIDDCKASIANAIRAAFFEYRETYFLGYLGERVDQLLAYLNSLAIGYENIQYAYSFLKDITLAYSEFKDKAYESKKTDYPGYDDFERFLIAGRFNQDRSGLSDIRHYYHEAPQITDTEIQVVRMLFERILLLIQGFTAYPIANQIKITPSFGGSSNLSKRSIPLYYNNTVDLVNLWIPELSLRKKCKSILSYFEEKYNQDPILPQVKEPLRFDIEKNDFYRIEGHIGKDFSNALFEINRLRKTYNLAFDVITLKFMGGDFNDDFNNDFDIDEYAENYIYKFSRFVKQHSGVEHTGGVSKGGTFIIVIFDDDGPDGSEARKVVADFSLPYPMYGCTELEYIVYGGLVHIRVDNPNIKMSEFSIYFDFPGIGGELVLSFL